MLLNITTHINAIRDIYGTKQVLAGRSKYADSCRQVEFHQNAKKIRKMMMLSRHGVQTACVCAFLAIVMMSEVGRLLCICNVVHVDGRTS